MNKIQIIGLGNYGIEELTLGVYRLLENADTVYVRTLKHPVIQELPDIHWQSFDEIYEKHDAFKDVYEEIVEFLLEEAKHKPVIYAVPGHPMVAERTTELLIASDADVEIVGGKSFIDDMFSAVQYDPNNGFQMLDATAIDSQQINPRTALIITQVYDQLIASDLKITLMERYPDDHRVMIVTGAKGAESKITEVPLYELDHDFETSNLTSVFVPELTGDNLNRELNTLNAVMDKLVSEEGCPWDKEQTHQSLKRYLIEESYELMEAIDSEDIDHMIEELGDILLQVVFHAAIAKKEMMFDINEIVESITSKMIRRHPHVFGDETVNTIDELNVVWQDAKTKEGKSERTFKMEKEFANLFMALYDSVQQGMTLEAAVKKELNQ